MTKRWKVTITYTATFETEVEAPTRNASIAKAGAEFHGTEDEMTAYGAIVEVKAASAKVEV